MILSSLSTIFLLLLAGSYSNALQLHPRVNERLARALLAETYIDTPGTPQDLCGNSTFEAVDHEGPLQYDCEYLMNITEHNPDGFWMAGDFGRDGTAWAEFTRLRSCGIRVRRTDGQGGDVPFGDQDVVDLMNSVLTEFSVGDRLPTVQGQMTCSKYTSRAAVEWQIFNV
ncbi:hypothetical protein N0V93_001061 [Gnomoniopsis smithogilvyi]|uniref:Ecp2 effector protein-like domain-containing protein n=1 Tax=Gnomoniopsis smithogilvyi TaxID=1191159 RepID=A0A9W8Z4V5_9PEZI|nr:hypothetical protein N0V93_001061 [Gnomoniopsis smithogilvyi]